MWVKGAIFDIVLSPHELKNADLYIEDELKDYNLKLTDIAIKFSFVIGYPPNYWIDYREVQKELYHTLGVCRWFCSEVLSQLRSETRGMRRKRYGDLIGILDIPEITSPMNRFMLFRPRLVPIHMLEHWRDVWTRPKWLCKEEWGEVLYYFIPPQYTLIEEVHYRISLSNKFQSSRLGDYYGNIYRSEDRLYFMLQWPCDDSPHLEIIIKNRKLGEDNFIKYLNKYQNIEKRWSRINAKDAIMILFQILQIIFSLIR